MTNRKTALQDMPGEIYARIDSRGSEWCLNPIYGTHYIRADLTPRLTDEELKGIEEIKSVKNQLTLLSYTSAGSDPELSKLLAIQAGTLERAILRRSTQADRGE